MPIFLLNKSIFLITISQYNLPIMKDLLYLKDEQIKDFIQLLFYAYRETLSDPKKILAKNLFGPAHLRALNLIERNPGTCLSKLMYQLKITKQSLNRVLRDLLNSKMIKQVKDKEDTRKKNLFLDREGKIFFDKIYEIQKKRIFNALRDSGPESVIKFKEVLNRIING
jgi:DNA-binding MarR family transcriptional regulator